MKLYTEEQVREAINKSLEFRNDDAEFYSDDEVIDLLTPIELPSDEEIESNMIEQDIVRKEGYCHCFLEGAKWMKEQILNQISVNVDTSNVDTSNK